MKKISALLIATAIALTGITFAPQSFAAVANSSTTLPTNGSASGRFHRTTVIKKAKQTSKTTKKNIKIKNSRQTGGISASSTAR